MRQTSRKPELRPHLRRYLVCSAKESKGIDCNPTMSNSTPWKFALCNEAWQETHAPLQDPPVALSRTVTFFENRLREWQFTTLVVWNNEEIAGLASWH